MAQIFAVGVGGLWVMSNHLHVLLWLDPDVAQSCPPRDRCIRLHRVR